MGILDVNTAQLIDELATEFQKSGIPQPGFVDFVKSGQHREQAPHRRDWYFVRMASILYRLYKDGPTGTGRLRTYYGGRKNRGVRKHHAYKASGKVIRTCLQALEQQGYIVKHQKGRAIAGKGQKLMNATAKAVAAGMQKEQARKEQAKQENEQKRQQWKTEKDKAAARHAAPQKTGKEDKRPTGKKEAQNE